MVKGKFDFRREREGYSLVELIVVIALMALLVGLAALSIGLLTASDSKGLASHINDGLTDLKAMTESNSGPYYMHIYRSADGYYVKYDTSPSFTVPSDDEDSTKLGSKNLGLEWVDASGNINSVATGDHFDVCMQKKDGAYRDTANNDAPAKIQILDEGAVEFTVVLAKDTGLHYVE